MGLKELKALDYPEEALLRALAALERDLEAGHLGVALELSLIHISEPTRPY